MIGLNNERQLARRALVGAWCMRKGSSLPTSKELRAQDLESVLPVWPERRPETVSSIAVGASRIWASGRRAKDLAHLWMSEHARSLRLFNVAQETDRGDEQSRRVCMCNVDAFGVPSDVEKSNFPAWSSRSSS